jgi:hypothetical protein
MRTQFWTTAGVHLHAKLQDGISPVVADLLLQGRQLA